MHISQNQRKVYLLALALMVTALALACAWAIWHTPADVVQSPPVTAAPTAEPLPSATAPASDAAVSPEETADAAASASQAAKKVSTIVYYQDNYGYLVPVMCSVPLQDGIAKATLGMMVQSADNDMQAARLGLRTVLPEGTDIDLDISGGLARIDLGPEVLHMADAAAETNMVNAVVQALTEFDTVERVEFLIDGQRRETLPHGTKVSGTFTRGDINLEAAEPTLSLEGAKSVRLYFPADSGAVIVPVTRVVGAGADINTAVLELAKGPSEDQMLESVVPPGCGLIDVQVENRVAKLNFTGEFVNLVQNSDGGRLALKALVLTCTQFDGIDAVEIYVDGQKYDASQGELGVPSFMNIADSIVYDALQTQSSLLFDMD